MTFHMIEARIWFMRRKITMIKLSYPGKVTIEWLNRVWVSYPIKIMMWYFCCWEVVQYLLSTCFFKIKLIHLHLSIHKGCDLHRWRFQVKEYWFGYNPNAKGQVIMIPNWCEPNKGKKKMFESRGSVWIRETRKKHVM